MCAGSHSPSIPSEKHEIMAEIKVYSTSYCPYCRAAESLLRAKGSEFEVIDVTHDAPMRARLVEQSGQRTVPQIFIDGESIGGFTELRELVSSGRFDEMVGKSG